MSTGRERRRRRDLSGAHGIQQGVLVDRATVPIVLLTDGDHMFSAEDHASLFGYSIVEDRRALNWRSGPEAFGLTEYELRSRIIIVSRPLWRQDDDQCWRSFTSQLKQLTGREAEIGIGDDVIIR